MSPEELVPRRVRGLQGKKHPQGLGIGSGKGEGISGRKLIRISESIM